jgi:cell division protein FtsB
MDLRQGLEAVEERARTEFGLIKKDETFILLLDD